MDICLNKEKKFFQVLSVLSIFILYSCTNKCYEFVTVQDCIDYKDVFIVTNAVIGGAGMIGYSFAFTADFNKVYGYQSYLALNGPNYYILELGIIETDLGQILVPSILTTANPPPPYNMKCCLG